MSFSTVLIISLAAGVILVIGGGLMMYMANLVKSAYDIKVQINTEVEERLTKMGEDLDKKSRWIKRDLLEEIEKIRVNLQSDNAAKLAELSGPLTARLDQLETLLRNERAEWVKAVDADRASIANLDARLKSVSKQVKDDRPQPPTPASPASAPVTGTSPEAEAPSAEAEPTSTAPRQTAAAKPASGAWLPELGSDSR